MKRLFTLAIALFCISLYSSAQTTLYFQNFDTSYTNWTLNTTDVGGDASLANNYWIVNNDYAGGSIVLGLINIPPTADEPAGIIGNPHSQYLHILSDAAATDLTPVNSACFNASGVASYFAAMNTSINTTAYDTVTLSFWWLCAGSTGSSLLAAIGEVYYRTSPTGTWTMLTGTNYNNSTSWTQSTITKDSFAHKAFLQFGFRFRHSITGNDPAFSVDDIKVVGKTSTTPVCPPITGLNHTGSGTSATISWTANTAPSAGYQYVVIPTYTVPTTGTATNLTTKSFTGLNPSTTYYVFVRDSCGPGNFSAWDTLTFHTGTSGVNQLNGNNETISLYPNPATTGLHISINITINNNATISLYDMTGKLLRTLTNIGDNNIMDMNGLPAGIYCLKYIDAEHNETIKVYKE
jgi:hypothetical protein